MQGINTVQTINHFVVRDIVKYIYNYVVDKWNGRIHISAGFNSFTVQFEHYNLRVKNNYSQDHHNHDKAYEVLFVNFGEFHYEIYDHLDIQEVFDVIDYLFDTKIGPPSNIY